MGSTPNKGSFGKSNIGSNSQTPYNAYIVAPETINDRSWYIDSDASHHITNNSNFLQQSNKYNGNVRSSCS